MRIEGIILSILTLDWRDGTVYPSVCLSVCWTQIRSAALTGFYHLYHSSSAQVHLNSRLSSPPSSFLFFTNVFVPSHAYTNLLTFCCPRRRALLSLTLTKSRATRAPTLAAWNQPIHIFSEATWGLNTRILLAATHARAARVTKAHNTSAQTLVTANQKVTNTQFESDFSSYFDWRVLQNHYQWFCRLLAGDSLLRKMWNMPDMQGDIFKFLVVAWALIHVINMIIKQEQDCKCLMQPISQIVLNVLFTCTLLVDWISAYLKIFSEKNKIKLGSWKCSAVNKSRET